jgi:capsule polysaccharide export protein KpsE/RkpR
MLAKRAGTLHLGTANYCWFTDPSRALCLKLAEEFERRLASLRQAGEAADPRDAQIARLKAENDRLRQRLADQEALASELSNFKTRAISQLTAQHAEIGRLRTHRLAAVRELHPDSQNNNSGAARLGGLPDLGS